MTYERRRKGSADYSDTYYYDEDKFIFITNSLNPAFDFGSGGSGSDGYVFSSETVASVRLCGNVPFCEPRAFVSCKDIPIKSCKECSLVKGSFFLFFLIFLGISIFIGNLLIIAVGYLRYKKRKINKLDILKVSLAIADLLTGMLSN